MLCDRCKMKEAKIYYTEITGGKKIEQHLCEDCAAELTSFQKEIPLESLLSGLLGIGSGSSRDRVCQVCGMSYQEFQKTGKFGCEHCYKTFGRLHQGTLKRIQGATTHTGKIAASWQKENACQQEETKQAETLQENTAQELTAKKSTAEKLTGEKSATENQTTENQTIGKQTIEKQTVENLSFLEKKLKEAITKEEYEEAAKLRDEIRSIKASREKGGCATCQENR